MTTPVPPWPAGQTPYVTPDQLYSSGAGASQWPTGVSWGTIPDMSDGIATPPQQYQVLSTICMQATTEVTQILNQPAHCTQTTEELSGPNYRVTVQWSSGNGRLIAARWPVTQVTSVQVSSNSSWPRSWTSLPAGYFEPEYPVDGLYGATSPSSSAGGQGILFSPGYVCWPYGWPGGQTSGRNSFRVAVTYFAGWPHTSLTAAVTAGATTIPVDDCAGWLLTGTNDETVGAAGIIYDAMGGGQEPVVITASTADTGPGTLTLASELQYAHQTGIMVSALPRTIIWATALLAGKSALTRGATATTIQNMGGHEQSGVHPLEMQAWQALAAYRRTI